MNHTEPQLRHIAIIMDGNRRWAKERLLPTFMGHTEGGETLKKIVEETRRHEIPFLTVYALSTENLANRSETELKHIFSLLESVVNDIEKFITNNVRMRVIGDMTKLPETTQQALQEMVDRTKENTAMTLTLAINYGGRDEILRAIHKVQNSDATHALTEASFQTFLDTGETPPVDLVIRTGGYQRLSNFLLWQAAYAELYFTPIQWPAFTEEELAKAIEWFHDQQRNQGK